MFDNKNKLEEFNYENNESLSKSQLLMGGGVLLVLVLVSFFIFFMNKKNQKISNINESGPVSNVFDLDSDGDGLNDREEKEYGTNPFERDTDGDSYSDKEEIDLGYNPRGDGPIENLTFSTSSKRDESREDDSVAVKNYLKQSHSPFSGISKYLSIGGILSLFFRIVFFILALLLSAVIFNFIARNIFKQYQVTSERTMKTFAIFYISVFLSEIIRNILVYLLPNIFVLIAGYFIAFSFGIFLFFYLFIKEYKFSIFTLIGIWIVEMIIAFIIFLIIMMPFVLLFISAMRDNSFGIGA
ncbi:MAG: thrombospondin type 3 repeat-containing protein [Patescibacteria group bacterium]|jgi:hypothetical protein|nr:thrombospondin type 3 repeat-containing protein [Patescibacteria group bacterium]